jgi:lysophospholipase L1-like esterase
VGTAGRADEVLTVSYPASTQPGELAMEARFHLWIPPQTRHIRAVIVHQHGCGEGAESFGDRAALDLHWRALAAEHDAALVSPHYISRGAECRLWCDPRNGSGAAFQRALVDLAAQSNHPELTTVPWCLWGHSGGGFWVSLMLEKYPERIVAAFCRSGAVMTDWLGETPAPHFPPAAYEIPVVLNPGLKERGDSRFDKAWLSTSNLFASFRARGAPVAFAPDPLAGHECRNSRLLAIPFFDACLRMRLPQRSGNLKPVKLSRGWAGDWETGTVKPIDDQLPISLSWLPDKTFARAFTEYVTTGKTIDRTPPRKSPVVNSAIRNQEGVTLNWSAEADLESGIGQFAVYRDGLRIALWPEKLDEKTDFAQFQGISYHDTPVSSPPPLAFTDRSAVTNGTTYSLSFINGAGLESPRSRPVTLPVQSTSTSSAASQPRVKDPAFEPVSDQPKLPRVLLIGDSISIGYTISVRNLLKGKANVHRIPENGGPTTNGLAKLPLWLGSGQWDVIHFNFGLHDLKLITGDRRRIPPDAYEKNLREIVTRLKTTGAKLIWASTTPVPEPLGNLGRLAADVPIYNAAAKKIMDEHQIPIDDLYRISLPELAKIQRPQNVHFTAGGYEVLGKEVAASISSLLLASSTNDIRWKDVRELNVEGRGWSDTKAFFDRLPAKAEGKVPGAVWTLSRKSAGMCVRFETDATALHARWTLTSPDLALTHMAATGVSGLDLYVKLDSGQWHWLAVGFPKQQTNQVELFKNLTLRKREYILYLPLYNGVQSLELGVPQTATLSAAGPWGTGERKPIVFYGTSILQGACASRPGMVHSSILGRRFNFPTINFGFSGNGRMESSMAELLAELDPSVYVLDCLPNMTAKLVTERVEPFVRTLRQSHPSTPIVLVEDRRYPDGVLIARKAAANDENHAALRGAFDRLKKSGVKNLYYIPGDSLLGDDGEGTVDSSHPTDLGFVRQAEVFAKTLKPLLKSK